MQKPTYSTTDLHPKSESIYLGYPSTESLPPNPNSYELSFFGGEPIWLHQPKESHQVCSSCNTKLSFLGQMYCPFEVERAYHRILYFLFCEGCLKEYRCIRQQGSKNWKKQNGIISTVRKIGESREIENEDYEKSDFVKMIAKTKAIIEEDIAIEEANSDEEEDVESEIKNIPSEEFKKYEELHQNEKESEIKDKDEEKKDPNFETYKKVISELENPSVLYTDTALLYNSRPLNPKHFCEACGSKLCLEVQITEKILDIENNSDSKLLLADWGSLMIYTCSATCNESEEECVVVQYEMDAIKEEDIKMLKKKKKNQKKKQKRSKENLKNKEKGEIDGKEEKDENENDELSGEEEEEEKETVGQQKESEGDWD